MIRRSNSFRGGSISGQKVTIRLLDDNEVIQVDFQSHHKGQFLMDYVCRQLNIAEKDYFGLRYVDSNKQRHWLDLGKSILKQLKEMTPYIVCVRFKFYPCDPMLLKEEVTRYQLVLQLRRDILHGRLYSTISDMAILASYIIQSELGDYDAELHRGNYVAEFELVSRQSAELEEKVIELHQKLKGMTTAESDVQFLKEAATLDTYGVDPHPVKDQQGDQVYIGINHTGISTFEGSKKSTHFKWSQITKLNYEAKMFIVHISIAEDSRTKKKETVGYKCQTSSACKYLWRCAVEQRLFYNCGSPTDIPASVRGGGLFGSRFKYSGRVQREILDDPGPLRASDLAIQRTPLYRSLQRNKTRSLPHSPLQLGYGSLPRSNHSAPPHESTRMEGALGTLGSSTSLPLSTLSSPYCPDHPSTLLETLPEDSPVEKENSDDSDATRKANGDDDLPAYVSTPCQSELFVVTSGTSTTTSPVVAFERSASLPSPTSPSSPLLSIVEETESEEETTKTDKDKPSPSPAIHFVFPNSKSKPNPPEPEPKRNPVVRVIPITLTNGHSDAHSPPGEKGKLVKETSIDEEEVKVEPKEAEPEKKSLGRKIGNAGTFLNTNQILATATEAEAVSLDSNANPVNSDQKLLNGAPATTNSPIAIATVTPNSDSNSVVKSEFLPNFQEQEDGYEVVPNDADHLLRESRIDQIGSQAATPLVGNSTPGVMTQTPSKKTSQAILSIGKIFIVCLICVLIALISVAIIAIELDVDICRKMRRIPEVELFQNELYEPIKYFFYNKFHSPSN